MCFVDFPRDRVPVVLAPLLYPETLDLPVSKLGIDSNTLPFSVCIEAILKLSYILLGRQTTYRNRIFYINF